jgi:hypothetical protein
MGGVEMNWNELTPIIEVCTPIMAALWAFYLRLSYRIDENSRKMDERWEKQRIEDQNRIDKIEKHWQWLFDWAHYEINSLKSRHGKS